MESYKAIINENGRILIPAAVRQAMHLHAGDEVTLILNDANLQIKTRKQVMECARQALKMNVPAGISLVDELIKERREDASRENY